MDEKDLIPIGIDASTINVSTLGYSQNYFGNPVNSLFRESKLSMSTIWALCSDVNIKNNIDFDTIIRTQEVSLDFIKKYYTKINKYQLFYYQTVSEDFIEEHISEFSDKSTELDAIAEKQKLSWKFINKHFNKFNIYSLFKNKNLKFSKSFFVKHLKQFTDNDFYSIMYISNLPNIIDTIISLLDPTMYEKLEWSYLSWNIFLSEDSIEKCIDYVDFRSPLLSNRQFKNDVITCYKMLKYDF